MMLSARSTVRVRRGNRFARPATAAASVGESTAPRTDAACDSIPSAWAVSDTATAVAITKPTLNNTMTRRFARIARKLVLRLSQYRIAGKNNSSTISPSTRTPPNRGISPSRAPNRMSKTGRTHPVASAEDCSHDHDRHERNDNFKAEHQNILLQQPFGFSVRY